jgi:hypothetical protein
MRAPLGCCNKTPDIESVGGGRALPTRRVQMGLLFYSKGHGGGYAVRSEGAAAPPYSRCKTGCSTRRLIILDVAAPSIRCCAVGGDLAPAPTGSGHFWSP